MTAVTVVVATHDRPDQLGRCLDSVLRSDHPDFDVIVVDNAPSSDATRALVADRYDPDMVGYVREPVPGLAVAHNAALPFLEAPVVAFTDDDVLVAPDWLRQLCAGFDAADDVACVTGAIAPAELETPAQLLVEQHAGYGKGDRLRIFDLADHRPDDRLFPFTAGSLGSGANMAFATPALLAMGGFDPALGAGSVAMGGDDLAAFFDIVARGHRLVYQPAAIVYHHHPRTYQAVHRQVHGYGVGLTAYLTKTVIDHPRLALAMARRLPGGLRHGLSAASPKHAGKSGAYPRALVRRERWGMLKGPALYLRSRWRSRHLRPPVRHLA